MGHYEYLVLLFGLALAVSQGLVNDLFRDMLNRFVFVYLDYNVIFSKSLEDHVQHVRAVLLRLLEDSLFVKAANTALHSSSVSFLGVVISPGNSQIDPAKVSVVPGLLQTFKTTCNGSSDLLTFTGALLRTTAP